jgi:hypothetical protein
MELTPAQLKALQQQALAEKERRNRAGDWGGAVRAHEHYRDRPVEWIVDHLDIAEHTIRWSQNPEYQQCYCPRCERLGNAGQPHLWDGDVDPLDKALTLIFQGKWVATPSGTGLGKTFVLGAACTLAFLATHERSVVFSLAPKHDLLLKNLWKGIGQMLPKFKKHFPLAQLLTGELRMLDGEGEKEVWTATAFGAGQGADEQLAAALKGVHHPSMLWIMEEGQGLSSAKVETIVKTSSGEFNSIVMLGNPKDQHDQLAAFGRRPRVTEIRISAYDFPNFVCGRDVIPGGRSRQSVLDDLEEDGFDESRPRFMSQVRGIAPAQSEDALIRQDWINASVQRGRTDLSLRDGLPALGIDVADSPTGDKSAFSRWQGAYCSEVISFRADDAGEVGRIAYREIMNPANPISPRHVGVDAVGVGASCVNELKRLGLRVKRLHGSAKAGPRVDTEARDDDGLPVPVVGAELYGDLRSAVYWTLREDIRLCRIGIPDDAALHEELTAMEYDPTPKIRVLKKDEIKAKIGRSPDKADALAYGNYVRHRAPARGRPDEQPEPELDSHPDVDTRLEQLLAFRAKRDAERQKRSQRLLRTLRRA